VWSLKPERWGSMLVQGKYREEKACDKRHPYRLIIIIIIMVQTLAQASVWRGRCHSVVESSSTHRQRSYSK
jgi:hypothetical protein